MPDLALQRLRRAQHPGDRGQARPADPQRHEHRRRAGRLRPRDRPPRRSVRHRRRAAAISAGAASPTASSTNCPRSGSRASATSSARSRRPSTTTSAPTTSSSRSPRTGRRCTTASARSRSPGTSPTGSTSSAAAEVFGEHLLGTTTDHFLELGRVERERIFNLGYFTWVEQQGVSLEDFEARRDPGVLGARSARSSRPGTT